jgi:ArsR family transcriptional regulator
MQDSDLDQLGMWLKVLAEPNRLRLLDLIIEGYQCNCQLGEELGLPANLISHHLAVLRESGLVETERDPFDARWVYYSVNGAALETIGRAFGDFCNPERIQSRRLTCGPQAMSISKPGAISGATGDMT